MQDRVVVVRGGGVAGKPRFCSEPKPDVSVDTAAAIKAAVETSGGTQVGARAP